MSIGAGLQSHPSWVKVNNYSEGSKLGVFLEKHSVIKGLVNTLLPPVAEWIQWHHVWSQDDRKSKEIAPFYLRSAALTTIGAGVAAYFIAAKLEPQAAGQQVYDLLKSINIGWVIAIAVLFVFLARALGGYKTQTDLLDRYPVDPELTRYKNSRLASSLYYGFFGSSGKSVRGMVDHCISKAQRIYANDDLVSEERNYTGDRGTSGPRFHSSPRRIINGDTYHWVTSDDSETEEAHFAAGAYGSRYGSRYDSQT